MERFPLKRKYFQKAKSYFRFNWDANRQISFRKIQINKGIAILMVVFASIVIVVNIALNTIKPVFLSLIQNKANSIATSISNQAINEKLKDIDYSDLIKIEKDQAGKINLIKANTYTMNQISNAISISMHEKLSKLEDNYVRIPIGSLIKNSMFTNVGPKIKIDVLPVGSVSTKFKSEFESNGINQTVHKIYIEVISSVSIITPFTNESASFTNMVLVSEVVIVGEVPATFYNIEGMTKEDIIDTM